jgi:hypothetical protein
MKTLLRSAQEMVRLAYEAEDGHFEQVMFDGRTLVATDYNETLILKDFRKTTAVWTEQMITFDELRALIEADDNALIDSGALN